MSNIPEARENIEDLVCRLRANPCILTPIDVANELDAILPKLWRERCVRSKAPTKRRAVTAEIRDAVKAYSRTNLTDNLDEIGDAFEIAGGRVSEILHGKYDHLLPGEIATWT